MYFSAWIKLNGLTLAFKLLYQYILFGSYLYLCVYILISGFCHITKRVNCQGGTLRWSRFRAYFPSRSASSLPMLPTWRQKRIEVPHMDWLDVLQSPSSCMKVIIMRLFHRIDLNWNCPTVVRFILDMSDWFAAGFRNVRCQPRYEPGDRRIPWQDV